MGNTSERIDGATPNGGVYSIAYWQDEKGEPTDKGEAVSAEIIEYDAAGKVIARTYMRRD